MLNTLLSNTKNKFVLTPVIAADENISRFVFDTEAVSIQSIFLDLWPFCLDYTLGFNESTMIVKVSLVEMSTMVVEGAPTTVPSVVTV